MKEDDVHRRKRAQPRQRREPLLLCLHRHRPVRPARLACLGGGPAQSGYDLNLCAQAVTRLPTFSPDITRRILPGWFRLKMIIGRLLSLHRLTAVVSITFNPSRRISI